jgi:hypothetical protein
VLARDLRKLAMLALPLGIRVAYEGLSWGRTINEFTTAWDIVLPRRLRPTSASASTSYHSRDAGRCSRILDSSILARIYLVQLADFCGRKCPPWRSVSPLRATFGLSRATGVHSGRSRRARAATRSPGYGGDFKFEVFNDDTCKCRCLPSPAGAAGGAMAVRGRPAPGRAAAEARRMPIRCAKAAAPDRRRGRASAVALRDQHVLADDAVQRAIEPAAQRNAKRS